VVVAQVFITPAFQLAVVMAHLVVAEPHQAGQVARAYRGKALLALQVAQDRMHVGLAAQVALQAHKPQV
jgi:hypothetical protein